MSVVVTISNPAYNYTGGVSGVSETVPVESFEITCQQGQISECVFRVCTSVLAKYNLEISGADANPVQLFSTISLVRDGAIWFYGYVSEKPLMTENANELEIHCLGKEGVLANTLCPRGGSYVWSASTTTTALSNVTLLPIATSGVYSGYWYPVPATANVWYSPPGVADVLPAGGIDDNQTTITLASGYVGFTEDSFMLIDSEYIYYEGYIPSGAVYQCTGCIRGALGTTAAAHLAGAAVTQRVVKQMAPSAVYAEYWNGLSWQDLNLLTKYQINPTGGYFLYPYGDPTYTYRASYSVYDLDSGLDIATLIADAVTADAALGGAGFAAGDHTIAALGIAIARIDYSPADITPYAWELIQKIVNLDEISGEVLFYYNHTTNKFKLIELAQGATPDIYVNIVDGIIRERNIFDIYSGSLVRYSSEMAIDRARALYGWRPDSGDGVPAWWGWRNGVKTVTDDNFVSQYAVTNSGDFAGPMFDGTSPSYPFDVLHLWFGADAPVVNLEKVAFTIATWGGGTWRLEVQGCADYSLVTNDTAGAGWVVISPDLDRNAVYGTAGGSSGSGQTKRYESTQFTLGAVNAIKLVAFAIPTDLKPIRKRLYLHDFVVMAGNVGYEYVKLVTSGLAQGDIEAPLSLQKIRGGINSSGGAGSPRNQYVDLGAASRGAAISIAMQNIRSRLKLYEARTYTIKTPPVDAIGSPVKPELGMTVEVDEGDSTYTGIVQGYTIQGSYDSVEMSLDVLDYSAAVIT